MQLFFSISTLIQYFRPENVVCFNVCCIFIQMHFKLDFIMEVNTINPDKTAPWSSLIRVHIFCNIGYQSVSGFIQGSLSKIQ